MNVLAGSLDHFALPDIFRLLSQNKPTGALKVVRASGDGTVFFREGEVYFAFSSLTREFLGQRLVNAKLITHGQLLRILDEQKKGGEKRVGDLMIEKGFISKDTLDSFLKEQIQDAIFSMLQWDVGSFEFQAGETAPQEVGLSVSVENLIMESSRRIQEWEVIRRKIPNLDVVLRMSPTPPENAAEINIHPQEWTLLVLADGTRTVREIAAASERSEFDACKIVYGLVSSGLLDVASGASAISRDEMPSTFTPLVAPEAPEVTVVLAEEQAERLSEEPPAAVGEPEEPEAESLGAWFEHVAEPEGDQPVPEIPAAVLEAAPEPSDKRKAGDPAVSKELLLRLISGVKNL